MWADQVKERDSHKCQVGDLVRAIAALLPSVRSDWECTKEVEAHHITYRKPVTVSDGITVCTICHPLLTTFERAFRYAATKSEVLAKQHANVQKLMRQIVEGDQDEVRSVGSKIHRHNAAVDAQWAAGITHERMVEEDKGSVG